MFSSFLQPVTSLSYSNSPITFKGLHYFNSYPSFNEFVIDMLVLFDNDGDGHNGIFSGKVDKADVDCDDLFIILTI